ncbi:hypothetical protein HY479_04115 [Candidatus Uhrbacteria bacterium]|nr:hypothetical protein [Candidatus Uhrbacteria bacterium]
MNKEARLGNALRVPDVPRLVNPQTQKDFQERDILAQTIRLIIPRTVDILLPSGPSDLPLVRFRYRGANKPAQYWARHLSFYINLVEGGGWIGRLSHISMSRCELFISPREDGTNDELAQYGIEQSAEPRIRTVRIGMCYGRSDFNRTFFISDLRTLH